MSRKSVIVQDSDKNCFIARSLIFFLDCCFFAAYKTQMHVKQRLLTIGSLLWQENKKGVNTRG
jgi:hypothetical protein